MIEAKRYDWSGYGKMDGVQRAGLDNGTWRPRGFEPDKMDGVQYAKVNAGQAAMDAPTIQQRLQALPDVVIKGTIEVAERLRAHKIDPTRPETVPDYLTADQVAETLNRAALYQPEYDRRMPIWAEKERTQAERAVRELIVHSAPLTVPDRAHTNGKNGTNGHPTSSEQLAPMPIPSRPAAAIQL